MKRVIMVVIVVGFALMGNVNAQQINAGSTKTYTDNYGNRMKCWLVAGSNVCTYPEFLSPNEDPRFGGVPTPPRGLYNQEYYGQGYYYGPRYPQTQYYATPPVSSQSYLSRQQYYPLPISRPQYQREDVYQTQRRNYDHTEVLIDPPPVYNYGWGYGYGRGRNSVVQYIPRVRIRKVYGHDTVTTTTNNPQFQPRIYTGYRFPQYFF